MLDKQTYKYVLFLASLLLCILVQNVDLVTFALDTGSDVSSSLISKNVINNTRFDLGKTIEILENLLKNPQENESATIHANLARAYEQRGDTGNAIAHFKEAVSLYEKGNDQVKLIEVLIEQAQVHNYLGQVARAIPLLEKAISLASKNKNAPLEATAWGVIGNSYFLSKKYELASSSYQKSLSISESLGNTTYITTALNNQANIYTILASWYESQAKLADNEGSEIEEERLLKLASSNRNNAISTIDRALNSSKGNSNLIRVKALLNALAVMPAEQYEQEISSILAKLPDSRGKAYNLIKLSKYQKNADKIDSLNQAISTSQKIGDLRTQSFALGELGQVYEQQGSLNLAKEYTQSAILTAQNALSLDSLYRWQWQAGRIYSINGDKAKAIDYYKSAIASLQSIRGDIASASKDLQFDVRDEVEPVYRQLIQLLLDSKSNNKASEVLEIVELLKLSELQNFFGDECLEVKSAFNSSTFVDDNSATITTFTSNNKLYLILHASNTFKSYSIPLDSRVLQSKVRNFRFQLEDILDDRYLALSQELYNLVIKPIEGDIEKLKLNKLVFINDGILRNIPMAALFDGKHFLIEKYPISYSLSNNLVKKNSRKFKPGLFFGLTKSTIASSALPNVEIEVDSVQNVIGGTKVLGKNFTKINFERQVKNQAYSIIHIATHGEFRGAVNSSSLQAYDSRISLQEFDDALRSRQRPIELLTLSACQTAVGDDRSTLGLAGLAARNGVKNVLASLWYANDSDAATLMQDFYRQITQKNISEAEALRNAQLNVVRDRANHPGRWASFILIES